jgi:hypothetical protein
MNFRNVVVVSLCAILIVLVCVIGVGRYWSWLSAPENSTAMQAAIAIVIGAPTLIFAAVGTLAAIESAKSSASQARAADRQAEAANEQIRLSTFQFDQQEKHFDAQRRIDRLRELAEYQRLVAEDDATRPRFAISSSYSRMDRANIELKNIGGGDALDVEITSPVGNSPRIKEPIVRAGQTFRCSLDLIQMEVQPAICLFTSRVGSRWSVQLRFRNALEESVASVIRPYESYIREISKD